MKFGEETGKRFVPRRPGVVLGAAALAASALVVYHNTFQVPFLFDDAGSVLRNTSIRSLWPIWQPFAPPAGTSLTVSARPFLNFTFALNYALGGPAVRGYHVANLVIHILAAWTLFGLLRLTLETPLLGGRFRGASLQLPLAVALVWAVHPILTEAVTYVVQRAESLVSLFYLVTLYAFARAVEPVHVAGLARTRWLAVSASSCLLGMLTKEVMVSAPLAVLLYDRTFAAGSFLEAIRRRRGYYLALAATWLPLAILVARGAGRGNSAGFGAGVAWQAYALTQCRAVVHYVRLVLWPHPLVFDYGTPLVVRFTPVALQACEICLGAIWTAWALRFKPALGFALSVFAAVLAPSSSVVPVATQTIAEHRMYLASAVLLSLLIFSAYVYLGRRVISACFVLAAFLGLLTIERNRDYRSELALWEDTAARVPQNARAQATLGLTYYGLGRFSEAIDRDRLALRLASDYDQARSNLGSALEANGDLKDAIVEFREVLRRKPDVAGVHCDLANALDQIGEREEAASEYRKAIALQPDSAVVHAAYADVLYKKGNWEQAASEYELALKEDRNDAIALQNLGSVRFQEGRLAEAVLCYRRAAKLLPGTAEIHRNLATALSATGQWPEAAFELRVVLSLDPKDEIARARLGEALVAEGRFKERPVQLEMPRGLGVGAEPAR